ncbi:MAG: hypothetical protein WBF90_24460 [Rivularia sp. (in: cyanobacteria)]
MQGKRVWQRMEFGNGWSLATDGMSVTDGVKLSNFRLSPNAQCPTPNAQCPIPNAQCPIPNAPSPMPNSQFSIFKLLKG